MKLHLGGVLTAFDEASARLVKRLPQTVGPAMSWFSLAGLPPVGLTGLALLGAVAVILGYYHIAVAAVLLLAAAGLIDIIKLLVHRTRPDTVYVATKNPRGYSFPSGHAADAVLVYGFVAYLAAIYAAWPWAVGIVAVCAGSRKRRS